MVYKGYTISVNQKKGITELSQHGSILIKVDGRLTDNEMKHLVDRYTQNKKIRNTNVKQLDTLHSAIIVKQQERKYDHNHIYGVETYKGYKTKEHIVELDNNTVLIKTYDPWGIREIIKEVNNSQAFLYSLLKKNYTVM